MNNSSFVCMWWIFGCNGDTVMLTCVHVGPLLSAPLILCMASHCRFLRPALSITHFRCIFKAIARSEFQLCHVLSVSLSVWMEEIDSREMDFTKLGKNNGQFVLRPVCICDYFILQLPCLPLFTKVTSVCGLLRLCKCTRKFFTLWTLCILVWVFSQNGLPPSIHTWCIQGVPGGMCQTSGECSLC